MTQPPAPPHHARLPAMASSLPGAALTHRVHLAIQRAFPQDHWEHVATVLQTQCGSTLPLLGDAPQDLVERIQFAIVKLCDGSVAALERHVKIAKVDWRDTLVAAGFGSSLVAHVNWFETLITAEPAQREGNGANSITCMNKPPHPKQGEFDHGN